MKNKKHSPSRGNGMTRNTSRWKMTQGSVHYRSCLFLAAPGPSWLLLAWLPELAPAGYPVKPLHRSSFERALVWSSPPGSLWSIAPPVWSSPPSKEQSACYEQAQWPHCMEQSLCNSSLGRMEQCPRPGSSWLTLEATASQQLKNSPGRV